MLSGESLFSGIGGFDLGLERAGVVVVRQVEIDDRARGVLARHWPNVERINDVRDVGAGGRRSEERRDDRGGHADDHGEPGDGGQPQRGCPDLIFGGFPCQDVSVAGRRGGIAAERSGLWYEFHRIIRTERPTYAIIENVEGLLSSNGGWDFATVLCGLAGWLPLPPNGGWRSSGSIDGVSDDFHDVSWAVLDSRYFGVPQRRRRVFIVAGPRGSRAGEQILAISEGGGGDTQALAEAGEATPASARSRADRSGEGSVAAGGDARRGDRRRDGGAAALQPLAHSLTNNEAEQSYRGDGFDNLIVEPLVFEARYTRNGRGAPDDVVPPLKAESGETGKGDAAPLVLTYEKRHRATSAEDAESWAESDVAPTLTDHDAGDVRATSLVWAPGEAKPLLAGDGGPSREDRDTYVIEGYVPDEMLAITASIAKGPGHKNQDDYLVAPAGRVRRLTPLECDRLQGFPDDWTAFDAEGARQSDSARYRQNGNAVTVTVAEWIGRRLVAYDALVDQERGDE